MSFTGYVKALFAIITIGLFCSVANRPQIQPAWELIPLALLMIVAVASWISEWKFLPQLNIYRSHQTYDDVVFDESFHTMITHLRRVDPAGTRVYMGTLTDDANIHESLTEIARTLNIQTATFEMLGGLHEVEFTAYNFVEQRREPPIVFTRVLEIVGGHGTISLLDNAPHIHLHLVVSFRDENVPHGIAVVGGHVARATAFAVEFTLTVYDGAPVHRAMHARTGLQLWDLG
jgi:predicted DNA-binding protein with PD1-like motif